MFFFIVVYFYVYWGNEMPPKKVIAVGSLVQRTELYAVAECANIICRTTTAADAEWNVDCQHGNGN